MSTKESQQIRTDLVIFAVFGALLVGACVLSGLFLRDRLLGPPDHPDEVETPRDGASSTRALRIPVAGNFDDTFSCEGMRENAVNARDIRFGVDPQGMRDVAFLRFPIELPLAGEVEFATIEFTASRRAATGTPSRNRIHLLDTDDQSPFSVRAYPGYGELERLPVAGTFVPWDTGPWEPGEVYRTSDIASLIRAFLRREEYVPGSCMGIRISPDPSLGPDPASRPFEAISRDGGTAPVLVIYLPDAPE